jgi:replicative DNA helicase
MVQKHKVGFIVVDYLQLMNGQPGYGTNREQEISTISRGLKAIAKELAVPVMALSQLSRAVETRHGTKMPQLSDLRESGAIEQDADVVMFIYRPAYYDAAAPTGGNAGSAPVSDVLPGETHIKFAKHRNGAVGDIVKLRAQLHIQKFEDLPLQNMYLHKATAMYV